MPIDPEKFKQYSRSPEKLASDILHHEFMPASGFGPAKTFQEQLFYTTTHSDRGSCC